jgi:hypothetical protein
MCMAIMFNGTRNIEPTIKKYEFSIAANGCFR